MRDVNLEFPLCSWSVNKTAKDQCDEKLRLTNPDAWRLSRFQEWRKTETGIRPFIISTKCIKAASKNGGMWSTFSSLAVVKHLPTRYEVLTGRFLSKSTVFGIRDVTKGRRGWIMRLDRPHPGAEFEHLNLNPKLTGMANPHSPLPSGVVTAGDVASKVANGVGKAALVAAIVVDTVRIGNSIRKDVTGDSKGIGHTIKTSASVGSGWLGGLAGALAGNSGGAAIGGAIGTAFGGIGAVPGAAIGSVIGCLLGGVSGGVGSSFVTEIAVDKIQGKWQAIVTKQGHIRVEPTCSPDDSEQENEWQEIVKKVITLIMGERRLSIISYQPPEEVFSYDICEYFQKQILGIYQISIAEKMHQDIVVQQVCTTPHFFYSALTIAFKMQLPDFKKLRGCQTKDEIPFLGGEYISMNSNGSTLYWLNPDKSAAEAVLNELDKMPYLKVKRETN